MSGSDVAGGEMDFRGLSDSDIEALIAGDRVAGSPGQLSELVAALRTEFDVTPTVNVGTALGEFIDVVDVTSVPAASGVGGKRRLATKAAAVFGAVSVKVMLGAAVAAASVGGAHALGVVDVPGLPDGGRSAPVQDDPGVPGQIEPDQGPMKDHDESREPPPGSRGPLVDATVPAAGAGNDGEGCEFGQETAVTGSAAAAEQRRDDALAVDACDLDQAPSETQPVQPQSVTQGPPRDVPPGAAENVPPDRTPLGG
jgi:hypothetical protein